MSERRYLYGFSEVPDWVCVEFVENLPKYMVCFMCGVVASEMVWTKCWHVFCPLCIESLMRYDGDNKSKNGSVLCPVDGSETPDDCIHTDRTPAEVLKSSKVACMNKNNGCDYEGPLGHLMKHFRRCGHHKVQCQICHITMKRYEVMEHATADCRGIRRALINQPDDSKITFTNSNSQTELLASDITSLEQVHTEVESLKNGLREHETFKNTVFQIKNEMQEDISRLKSDAASKEEMLLKRQKELNNALENLQSTVTKIREDISKNVKQIEDTFNVSQFTWQVRSFSDLKKTAMEKKTVSFNSEEFFTGFNSYCVSLQGYIHEKKDGRFYLALYMNLKKGIYDGMLEWPYRRRSTLTLIDHIYGVHTKQHVIKPECAKSDYIHCFQRPKEQRGNMGYGNPSFMLLEDLEDPQRGYIKDDGFVVVFNTVSTEPVSLS